MTELVFLGTGTSQGVPMIGCHCEVCSSGDPRDKRLRSSVLIKTGGLTLVVDSGPDFRQQMLREDVDQLDAILFTHNHKDHMAGLDDVRAYNFFQDIPMDVYAEPYVLDTIRREYPYAFDERKYPGVPEIELHEIGEEPFDIKGVAITPIRGYHLCLPVLGFRVGRLAYLTDMNRIEEPELEKLKGLDVLVINALQRKDHISHFSLEQAVSVIDRVSPRCAYLTHLSHRMGLHADLEPEFTARHIHYACDGLKIETE